MPCVISNPFTVCTVNEYSEVLFDSVRKWSQRYILTPLGAARNRPLGSFFRICITCLCVLAFLRTDLLMLLLAVPLISFAYASEKLGMGMKKKKGYGVSVLWGLLTLMVIGVIWIFITVSGSASFDISGITFDNAEYQTDLVLMSFSGLKYLFVVIVALACLMPNSMLASRIYSRLGKRLRAVADYGSMALLLVMFVFTVVFFLPQFSVYYTEPFVYVVI